MTVVLIIGLLMTLITLAIAGRRVLWLFKLITGGQPAPGRIEGVTGRLGTAVKTELVEVFGQKKLLKWTVPGAAHFFVFWAFVILGSVYLEAFGIMFSRNPHWHIPIVGTWDVLGFAQDLIAVLCLVSLVVFAKLRLSQSPEREGRQSRFSGSHLGGAWLVLFMIFNVIWTLFLFRGAAAALGNFPYGRGAFMSHLVGDLLGNLPHGGLEFLEKAGLLLHIGVMLVFLIDVLHSKHLHIFLAPINVLFKRQPIALGAAKPMTSDGKVVTLDDLEDMDEDTRLGIGSIEDFSWKGMLDFATCTECGRCQSQCPAWNTEKPLSPKMLIMNLRDHAMGMGDYLISGGEKAPAAQVAESERPLVGPTEGDPTQPTGGGVIDPDVLWSCVTCGACVEQCPVDIEHVDHILDMRRYQVLVESNFPAELNQLFKGMESKGNPWNMSPSLRMDWAKGLDFEVPVVGEDLESLDSVDWLFWVGCAGAYEDRAKKTTRAVAELLNIAGVSFGVLGNGETCTGDSARRAGNEFVFQGLATANAETFKEYKVKKVVSTCAHCFNTLRNEYSEFGVELEVVHHTQLLNRLVREGRLTPVREGAGAAKRTITYHDPCYLGRHNQVYEPPRELLEILPGAQYAEMERSKERSFCCGAGGARMWMEETIGSRINENRTTEAVATGADQIAVGCPFCRVMLADGLTAAQAKGEAREEVEVLDVAQMLLASVKGEPATKAGPGVEAPAAKQAAPAAAPAAEPAAPATATATVTEAPVEPASGGSLFDAPSDGTPQSGGSLFDTPSDGAPAKDAPAQESSGGSLFDGGGSLFDTPAQEAPKTDQPAKSEEPASLFDQGGSLFDTPAQQADQPSQPAEASAPSQPAAQPTESLFEGGGSLFDVPETPASPAQPATEPASTESTAEEPAKPAATPAASAPASEIPEGGSLFDLAAPEAPAAPAAPAEAATAPAEPAAEPKTEAQPSTQAAPAAQPQAPVASGIPEGGSLFDIAAPEPAAPSPAAEASAQPAPGAVQGDVPGDQPGDPETILDANDEPTPPAPAARPVAAAAVATEIPEGGSLFDISAPEPEAAPAPQATAAAPEAAPAGAPVGDAPGDQPGDPETILDAADDEAADEADDETERDSAEEPSTPPAEQQSGHSPRTDVDINDAGSLFDL